MSRPHSVIAPESIDALVLEFQTKPFNVSERARKLGVNRSALLYHLRGGKVGAIMRGKPSRVLIRQAWQAIAKGDKEAASDLLKKAAAKVLVE